VKLRDIGTEGQNAGFDGRKPYKLYSFSVPFGVGVKFSLNSRFSVSGEWGLRKTFSDYLDDVSRTYYLNLQDATPDPGDPDYLAQSLSDPTFTHDEYMERGDPANWDWYNFTGITLTYKFRLYGGRKCPDQQLSGAR
jgi:hypothetical protein